MWPNAVDRLMRGDKIVELRNGNTVHSHHEHVEFTWHALQRRLERIPHISIKELASIVSKGLMKDWKLVPAWFSVRSWSKRDGDRFIVLDDLVIVVAADKGRGRRRVVKTIVTRDCAD